MRKTIAIAALALLAGCNKAPAETTQQLMKNKVQPAAQFYWDSVRFVTDLQGEHDIKPTTDAEWEKVRQAAVDLQEYGKLLQTDAYTAGRNPDWTKFSQGLVEIAKQAEKAAKDKSPDEVFDVGGTMYNVCSACHTIYPPPVPPAASDSASTSATA
jgi:hypothetical protein